MIKLQDYFPDIVPLVTSLHHLIFSQPLYPIVLCISTLLACRFFIITKQKKIEFRLFAAYWLVMLIVMKYLLFLVNVNVLQYIYVPATLVVVILSLGLLMQDLDNNF